MHAALIILAALLIFAGCSGDDPETAEVVRISPGPPQHFDVGDQRLKNSLPKDVDDGYLEFAKTPGMSYGLLLAHDKISPRSHERHDMLIYIHNGFARFHVGEKSYWVNIGDSVYIPRGAVYSVESKGSVPLEFFVVYTPTFDQDDIVYHDEPGSEQSRKSAAEPRQPSLKIKRKMGNE